MSSSELEFWSITRGESCSSYSTTSTTTFDYFSATKYDSKISFIDLFNIFKASSLFDDLRYFSNSLIFLNESSTIIEETFIISSKLFCYYSWVLIFDEIVEVS